MKEKNEKLKMSNYIKRVSIAACSVLVIFFGGCTYAHVNGTETIISPLLRNLEINSKYEEEINVSKLEDSKTYGFENPQKYKIAQNAYVTVTEFITGSYTNMLKIKTDKTNYNGDSFEKYYKILDEQNEEIATFCEEEKQYDETIYNDRIISERINKNSKITIEVYLKMIDEEKFNKVATIPVDISKAVEKSEENSNWKQYKNENYSFKYNENWTLTTKVDSDKVGPNSAYLGALQLEIPSTTNSEYTSSIYVSTVKTNTTLDEYVKQQKELNSQEDINEKNTKEIKINNNKAYQVTSESTDGENGYIMQQTFLSANGNIYTITFFGDEKEYNNLKTDINQFINGFEI